MNSLYRLIAGVVITITLAGCQGTMTGAGNDPLVGAVLGVQGIVETKQVREQRQQKQQKQAVVGYLEKRPK